MGEKITNALWEIKRISAMLDNDRSHWGAEAHEGARRLNEELCNLFARTDFLNQSELHNFRYRKDK